MLDLSPLNIGAASDKVAALEKAGAFVTDSPAKIGSTMLKVCRLYSPGWCRSNIFYRLCRLLGSPRLF